MTRGGIWTLQEGERKRGGGGGVIGKKSEGKGGCVGSQLQSQSCDLHRNRLLAKAGSTSFINIIAFIQRRES